MKEIKIGIIGTGVMGADHAAILAEGVANARLAAVQDFDRSRAETIAASLGVRAVADADTLIGDPDIDAVMVCSPDGTHASLALKVIAARKPVLVEKPLAGSLEDAEAIVRAEVAAGRRLVQVGFMRRFDAGYREMKQALASGELGRPLFLHCVHRNAVGPDYLTSELVIANSAGHEFDIARYLLDEEITSAIVASPPATRNAPNRQPQFILLQTGSGVVVDIEVFTDAQYGYDVRAELVCEDGTVALDPSPATTLRAKGHDGFRTPSDWRPRFRQAYRAQLEAWTAGILTQTPSGSSAWDGYMAMLVTKACLQAWKTGTRAAVEIPEKPSLYRYG
ncbi:Gfo/Idh/MocA family oxidoreductase [Rhizobium sp. LjRoot258]|uniref:Gfo/Idh/MocA family oxidoreductase n=1 Tax=Rhizobium sp. LjRoot258 TaxID=3342299 RepID=UPI003ECD6EA1